MAQAPHYTVRIKRSAERELRKLPTRDMQRIARTIETLGANPRPPGCQKLAEEEAYRVRQGDYRIVYVIADERKVVEIIKIGHRRDVYR